VASPKVSKQIIEQEIDLKEVFGIDLAEASRSFKESFAQSVIDLIVDRTERGQGLRFDSRGRAQAVALKSPYSDEYAESLEFKAAGKSKGRVNMTLTGDMLASVDVLGISGNKIRIGIEDGREVLKAFNHITGDTVPSRPWFGVSTKELDSLSEQFQAEGQIQKLRRPPTPLEDKALSVVDRLKAFIASLEDDDEF
jgi:hypothetical protein